MLATSTEMDATLYTNRVSGFDNLTQLKTRKEILAHAYKFRNGSQSVDVNFAELCHGKRQKVKSESDC